MNSKKPPPGSTYKNSLIREFQKKNSIANQLAESSPLKKIKDDMNRFSQLGQSINNSNSFLAENSHSIDPLINVRDQANEITNQIEKLNVWRRALEIQSSLNISNHLKTAITGLTIDKAIFSGASIDIPDLRINRILSELREGSIYQGEWELDEENIEEYQEADTEIILPESIEHRIQQVNFLPITLYQKIVSDPSLMRIISPTDFEYFVAELIEKLGFKNVSVTPQSGDGGRDIIATKYVADIPMLFAFECKRYAPKRKIQMDTMRALLGVVSHSESKANKGVLVTTSFFTSGAKKLIASEALLDGKDFDDLVHWIAQINR